MEVRPALAFAPVFACYLYQADQKGEVELLGVIRKWRMKGEAQSLSRDGNDARECGICSLALSAAQRMPGRGHVPSAGGFWGKITVL